VRRALLVGWLAIASTLASTTALGTRPPPVNPLGLFYNDSFENFEAYERPTAMMITGSCNRDDPRFAQARAAGAEVLAYVNAVAVYDNQPCKRELRAASLYGPNNNVPLWPFPRYGERSDWPKTRMTDVRVGSAWSNRVVEYVERLMREGKVDGILLDALGARPWSKLSQWKTWDQGEQDAWTLGCIDLVRRIDASRRAINPRFIVVNNSPWDRGDALGYGGEKYVDGIMLEHPEFNDYHTKLAMRTFGNLGHRRVLVIARSTEDAQRWAQIPGVTHISDQKTYGHPDLPPVPFAPLHDR
jgi:hypothetical protein